MELILNFSLSSLRCYVVPKRNKNKKGIALFPSKFVSSYLDYNVDFSRKLQTQEHITKGTVSVQGKGLNVEAVTFREANLSAFISGGISGNTYYLTYQVTTNLGNELVQEMVLPLIGKSQDQSIKVQYSYLSCTEQIKPPNCRPPLNGLKINDRYLLNSSGFFMVI